MKVLVNETSVQLPSGSDKNETEPTKKETKSKASFAAGAFLKDRLVTVAIALLVTAFSGSFIAFSLFHQQMRSRDMLLQNYQLIVAVSNADAALNTLQWMLPERAVALDGTSRRALRQACLRLREEGSRLDEFVKVNPERRAQAQALDASIDSYTRRMLASTTGGSAGGGRQPMTTTRWTGEASHIASLLKEMNDTECSRVEALFNRLDALCRRNGIIISALGAATLSSVVICIALALYMVQQREKSSVAYSRNLIEASLDPLMTISREGKVTDVNKATELVTGVPRERLIGSDFSGYFGEPEAARKGYELALAEGAVKDYPLAIKHISGGMTYVLYNASVYRNAKGEIEGVFAAARETGAQHMKQHLAAIVESSEDAIISQRQDGTILSWNKASESIFGHTAQEIVGKHISTIIPPDLLSERERLVEMILAGERISHYETKRKTKDNRTLDIALSIAPIKDRSGKTIAISTIERDITENRRLEEEVRRSAVYTRNLIETNLDPLVTISPDGKITDVNKATELATGVERSQLIGTEFSDYFTEPDKARAGYERVLSEGHVKDYPLTIRHTSGSVTHVLYNASVFRDEQGALQGVFAAARDMAGQVAVQHLAAIVESSTEAIISQKLDGTIVSANRAAQQLFGYSEAELKNQHISLIIPPELLHERERLVERIFHGESVLNTETERLRKNGSHVQIALSLAAVRDESGKPVAIASIARDITEEKRAAQELRDASLYVRSLIEASLDPLVTISPQGKITDVNKSTESVTGLPREHLIGTDFSDYFTEPENARKGYQQVLKNGFVKDYPLAIRNASGAVTLVLYNATLYKNQAGEPVGVFAAARDVTERQRLEQAREKLNEELELKVAQRTRLLEEANRELEAFSYSVSHDLRAPLRTLSGFSLILLEDYGSILDDEGKDCLRRIMAASKRMSTLIDDLLGLSRIGRCAMNRQLVNLSDLAKEVQNDLELDNKNKRDVRFQIKPDMVCDADCNLVRIVLQNLMRNAWKFTGQRQQADIEVGSIESEGEAIYFVRDNGAGFDMAFADKLFSPFQRLHAEQEFPGNGIGLAITKRIVQRHNGRIWAEAEPGRGATFCFTLKEKSLPDHPSRTGSVPKGDANETENCAPG